MSASGACARAEVQIPRRGRPTRSARPCRSAQVDEMRVDRGRLRSPVDRPEAVWLADSEWRRFVAFGGVGVVECALGFDALGAGFTAGASSFGHHQSAVLGGFDRGGWRRRRGYRPGREEEAASGFGGVGVAGGRGDDDGAVGQLLIGPSGQECLDQMVTATRRKSLHFTTACAYVDVSRCGTQHPGAAP